MSTPWPRLVYNGHNVDFTQGLQEYDSIPFRVGVRNQSVSRIETLNINSGYNVRAVSHHFDNTDSADNSLRISLLEASMWASEGRPWTFLVNRLYYPINTTLLVDANAGASSIRFTDDFGLIDGSQFALETVAQVETVLVDSHTPGSIAVLNHPLNRAWPAGSKIRLYDYLPMVGTINVRQHTGNIFWDVEIVGQVDRSAL